MTDKNNRTMKTGDVVEITGAYFKNDNGLYFVEHTPGDPNWSGRDHCLRRIKRNGELSTAKDNLCFWPISAFVNSRDKRAAANEWNREHAEIEIKAFPHTEHIAAYFASEADSLDVVDLVMSIEDEFGLEVPDDQIENFRTVGDVVRYIEENS